MPLISLFIAHRGKYPVIPQGSCKIKVPKTSLQAGNRYFCRGTHFLVFEYQCLDNIQEVNTARKN
jgi:hypothetical protein